MELEIRPTEPDSGLDYCTTDSICQVTTRSSPVDVPDFTAWRGEYTSPRLHSLQLVDVDVSPVWKTKSVGTKPTQEKIVQFSSASCQPDTISVVGISSLLERMYFTGPLLQA